MKSYMYIHLSIQINVHVYIYVYTHIIFVCVHICRWRERETEREREREMRKVFSDGFPVVLPTRARVEAMLRGSSLGRRGRARVVFMGAQKTISKGS